MRFLETSKPSSSRVDPIWKLKDQNVYPRRVYARLDEDIVRDLLHWAGFDVITLDCKRRCTMILVNLAA